MRNKLAYWSVSCYPLALVCTIACFVLMHMGDSPRAIGFGIVGIYMLVMPVFWTHLAEGLPLGPSNAVIMGSHFVGAACGVALLVSHYPEITTNWIILGALLSPIVGRPLAGLCEHVFGRLSAVYSGSGAEQNDGR